MKSIIKDLLLFIKRDLGLAVGDWGIVEAENGKERSGNEF